MNLNTISLADVIKGVRLCFIMSLGKMIEVLELRLHVALTVSFKLINF